MAIDRSNSYDPFKKPWVKGYRPAQWRDRPKGKEAQNFLAQQLNSPFIVDTAALLKVDMSDLERRVVARLGDKPSSGVIGWIFDEASKITPAMGKINMPIKPDVILDNGTIIEWKTAQSSPTGRLHRADKPEPGPQHPFYRPQRSDTLGQAIDRAASSIKFRANLEHFRRQWP